jgi:hypothetical protein
MYKLSIVIKKYSIIIRFPIIKGLMSYLKLYPIISRFPIVTRFNTFNPL